ncbi:MAG: hypothetical protein QOH88_22 [Verrucomicrobiota bacterium]|jgi:hypothetical protein
MNEILAMKKLSLLRIFALLSALALFASCKTVWIPLEKSPRAAVKKGEVQFLDAVPTRPHVVIGIITPPAGEYDTEAEAVKAMRSEAAKHGADAIFPHDLTPESLAYRR